MEQFVSQDPRSYSLIFRFENLISGLKRYLDFRETGPITVFPKTTDCCRHSRFQNHRAKQSNKMVLMRDLFIFTKFTKMCVEKVRKSRRFEGAPPSSVVLVLIRDLPIRHRRLKT